MADLESVRAALLTAIEKHATAAANLNLVANQRESLTGTALQLAEAHAWLSSPNQAH